MSVDPAYTLRLSELAARSQLFWALAVASVLVLALVVCALGRRCGRSGSEGTSTESATARRLPWWRRLHEAESATASLEFLLVLFPFLMIVLTIWQLAFMFNAQLHVGYAAYAAARSASVMIPAEIGTESPDQLRRSSEASGGKWDQIRRAAIPGTLAISPGDGATAAAVGLAVTTKRLLPGNPGGAPQARIPDPGVLAAIPLWTLHYGFDVLGNLTRLQRAGVKAAYADSLTEVLVNGSDDDAPQTISGETVEVTVNYAFWLHVPYVGGLMEALFDERPADPRTGQPILLNPYPSMTLSEQIVMTNWRQRCAIARYCP